MSPSWFAQVLVVVAALFSSFLPTPALAARTWEKVVIPGAICADGSPYWVFISRKDPEKIAFTFEGGGACWSETTCFGKGHTVERLKLPAKDPSKFGMRSEEPGRSPIPEFSIVFVPYCTADAHIGTHVVDYGRHGPLHHMGHTNFERAVPHLVQNSGLDFKSAKQLLVYGESAGALGVLNHITTIDPYLGHGPDQEKILLVDSPGLHFGADFFDRFPNPIQNDFFAALDRVGMKLRPNSGNLAPFVPAICRKFPDWRVGVLQGSWDMLMSLFGGTPPIEQWWRIAHSKSGLYQLTRAPGDNCSAWVPRTGKHTFLTTLDGTTKVRARGVTAWRFARDLIEGKPQRNYR